MILSSFSKREIACKLNQCKEGFFIKNLWHNQKMSSEDIPPLTEVGLPIPTDTEEVTDELVQKWIVHYLKGKAPSSLNRSEEGLYEDGNLESLSLDFYMALSDQNFNCAYGEAIQEKFERTLFKLLKLTKIYKILE